MMTVIDAHCDVLSKLLVDPTIDFAGNDSRLDVTKDKLRQAGSVLQCFAIWIPESLPDSNMGLVRTCAEMFHSRIIEQAGMAAVRTSGDLQAAVQAGRPGALLTLEGADALNGRVDHVRELYRLGVRMLGLTWNFANWAADGVSEPRNGGLTLKGRRLVKECESLGIIIDVSHLAERSFWEVAELSGKAFVASHSNVFELCGHARNLNKRQITCIAERGGVIGINFFPPFVSANESATIDEVVRHIETVCEWGGERAAALGADFDGIGKKVPGLEDPCGYARLEEALSKRMSAELVERVMFRNWYEYFVTALPKSEC